MKGLSKHSNIFKQLLFLVFILILSSLWAVGCLRIPAGVAASNTPLKGRDFETYKRVKVKDASFYLFGFIPLSDPNDLDSVIEEAVSKSDAEALVDILIEYKKQWYVIVTHQTTMIYATPIRFVEKPKEEEPTPRQMEPLAKNLYCPSQTKESFILEETPSAPNLIEEDPAAEEVEEEKSKDIE